MTDEQRDLENLTMHPGWLIFSSAAKEDIAARLENALTNAANDPNDANAMSQVRQCIAVRQAVRALLTWPESKLRSLKAAESTTTGQMSRRGNL